MVKRKHFRLFKQRFTGMYISTVESQPEIYGQGNRFVDVLLFMLNVNLFQTFPFGCYVIINESASTFMGLLRQTDASNAFTSFLFSHNLDDVV